MPTRAKARNVFILLFFLAALFFGSFVASRLGVFEGGSGLQSSWKAPFSKDKVAVIYLVGMLNDSDGFLEELDKYREMEDVRAIVVRIDSPGGAIVPAQEIYEEIRKLKGRKTIVASLGNTAASGGYYVACAADEIVASRGTITGSIGVIALFQNFRGLMDKIGFRLDILKSGEFKDVGNPTRPMTKPEMALEQAMLDNLHEQFVSDVAVGRNRAVDEIRPLADGRAFTGEQAKEVGLVDRLGNLQDSIDRAAEISGIKGKPVVLYPPEERLDIWEFVLKGVSSWFRIQLNEAMRSLGAVAMCSSVH